MMVDKYDKWYKDYLKMEERVYQLEKELKATTLIPLESPVQSGWEIFYDLRPDIKQRKDVFDILQVLDIGYSTHFTKDVKEVKMIRRGEKGYKKLVGKKYVYKQLEPGRRPVREKEYKEIPDKLKSYFYLDTASESYIRWGHKYYYASLPHFYLVVKARPHYVTHYEGKGGKLQQERDFLRDKLSDYYMYMWNYKKSYPRYKDRAKTRAKIRKFLKGEIDDISNDRIPMEYEW